MAASSYDGYGLGSGLPRRPLREWNLRSEYISPPLAQADGTELSQATVTHDFAPGTTTAALSPALLPDVAACVLRGAHQARRIVVDHRDRKVALVVACCVGHSPSIARV